VTPHLPPEHKSVDSPAVFRSFLVGLSIKYLYKDYYTLEKWRPITWRKGIDFRKYIFASFIKQSHPSPYHWSTHGMFSIHVTKLTKNFSQFHVLRIQETDYRPHFTRGRILYFLKHHKHTARCVNTVRMSANCVRALPQNQQSRHACAPSWPQHCSDNIRKRTLFSG